MYDFYIQSLNEDMIEKLSSLGYRGACYVDSYDSVEYYREVKENTDFEDFDLIHGVVISPETLSELKQEVSKFKDVGLLVLRDPKRPVFKGAVKKSLVDMIDIDFASNHLKRGFAKLAGNNNIALNVSFRKLVGERGLDRSYLFSKMKRAIRTARKNEMPVVLSSGADELFKIKHPHILIGFGQCLGLTSGNAKDSLTKWQEKVINRESLKKEGRYLSKGLKKT